MTTPTSSPQQPTRHRLTRRRLGASIAAAAALASILTACGGSSSDTTAATGTASTVEQILPVDTNPIANPATATGFTIDSVLVENNEDVDGNAVDDHLEIAVTNTTTAELASFEVFYTYADPITSASESYYVQLPADFTIAAGATRVIHFDNTGADDHFPVNAFSLYYTDANALEVTVELSATDAAPQTATVQKDAGGAEVPD